MLQCGIPTTIHQVPTKVNPADLATRGMTTTELQNSHLWYKGPKFLRKPPEEWPQKIEGEVSCPAKFRDLVYSEIVDSSSKKKRKPLIEKPLQDTEIETVLHVSTSLQEFEPLIPFHYTNSLTKLTSIVYWRLTMLCKLLPKKVWESDTMLAFSNCTSYLMRRKLARKIIILQHYKESEALGLKLPPDLECYTDSHGFLRVLKQITSNALPQEANEPVVIYKDHPLAALIMRETHVINGHSPELYTVSAIKTLFWIPHVKALAKTVVSSCVDCKKVHGLPFKYPHSKTLPDTRTEPSKPFAKSGLDYMGPVEYIKDDGITKGKAYVLVYTCLITRGAVLRVLPDATTETYLMGLRSIFHTVGVPTDIYSDNAAIFKLGASMINQDIIYGDEMSESLTSYLAAQKINFFNTTPLSPWQGGVYERVVGLAKHQIYKVSKLEHIDMFSLQYLVSGAQAMINSRPLTPHARSPNDMIALRPIDFQIPGVMLDVPLVQPEANGRGAEQRARSHLARLEAALNRLWQIWTLGYLFHLRKAKHRNKKCTALRPSAGQVVLINTNNVNRHKWPLGVIIQVHESNEVRTATVKAHGKLYLRSVCQLIPLEVQASDDFIPSVDTPEEADSEPEEHECGDFFQPPIPGLALFDSPNTQYAPEAFPPDTMPSIENQLNPKPNSTGSFTDRVANHDTIGDVNLSTEGIDYNLPNPEFDDVLEYEDPNNATTPETDHAEAKSRQNQGLHPSEG